MSARFTLTLLPFAPLTTETAKNPALVTNWQGFCFYGFILLIGDDVVEYRD
jgi:hypothetical protein